MKARTSGKLKKYAISCGTENERIAISKSAKASGLDHQAGASNMIAREKTAHL
jgi:hypothetical protein